MHWVINMNNRYADIITMAQFVRETQLKYGNPAGLTPQELSKWSAGLNIKNRGETVFYTGMYPYMGYAEVALKMEYLIKKENLEISDLLKWFSRATIIGYQKNMKGLVRLLSSPFSGLGKIAGISQKTIETLREISKDVEKVNDLYQEKLRKGAVILQKTGIDFAYLGEDEPDSGVVLHTMGFLDEFKEHAEKTHKKLKELGVKKIITMDPITGIAFKSFYPQLLGNFDIEVKHFVEVINLNENVRKDTVVFHDPCYLARHWKLVSQPRILLKKSGFDVVDPPNSGEKTRCDGGATEYQDPIGSVRESQIRLKELLSTGQKNVVTACPACLMLFRVGKDFSEMDAKLFDIVDLIYEGLGK